MKPKFALFIRRYLCIPILGALIIALPNISQAQERVFKAGASTSNITPPLGLEIVGNYNSPIADYVHDQINAKFFVIHDGNESLVFVIVDNVSVKREVYDTSTVIISNKINYSS